MPCALAVRSLGNDAWLEGTETENEKAINNDDATTQSIYLSPAAVTTTALTA